MKGREEGNGKEGVGVGVRRGKMKGRGVVGKGGGEGGRE